MDKSWEWGTEETSDHVGLVEKIIRAHLRMNTSCFPSMQISAQNKVIANFDNCSVKRFFLQEFR